MIARETVHKLETFYEYQLPLLQESFRLWQQGVALALRAFAYQFLLLPRLLLFYKFGYIMYFLLSVWIKIHIIKSPVIYTSREELSSYFTTNPYNQHTYYVFSSIWLLVYDCNEFFRPI